MTRTVTRSAAPGSLRFSGEPGAMPAGITPGTTVGVLSGHFALFNVFTEIDDWGGPFLERIAPGAFLRTIADDRARMRALFQHGRDPQIGDKPLGPIVTLREDDLGAYYEVALLADTNYIGELVPGLRAGVYGASFRFRVMREEIVEDPGVSEHNPNGLPERTILEAQVLEFGPCTFPAYEGATAQVAA